MQIVEFCQRKVFQSHLVLLQNKPEAEIGCSIS